MAGPDRDEDGRLLQYRGPDWSSECSKCPCASPQGNPSAPVRAFGATGGLAIVGEGPGSEEVYQGYPFIGPSGKLVDRVLNTAGIDRALIWVTNGLLCPRPNGPDTEMEKALECCRPRLEHELRAAKPTAILALGGSAMRALQLPVTGVLDGRGTVQNTPICQGVPVFSTLHPAALLRGGSGEVSGGSNKQNLDTQMLFFQADVEKAHKVATGQMAPYWSDDIEAFVPDVSTPPEATQPSAEPTLNPEPQPETKVAGFDPIAYATAEKWPVAFRDYFATNRDVWEEFVEVADKGMQVNASMEMMWGVLGFNMAEKNKQVPAEYKPYYIRLYKAKQEASR